MVSKYSMSGRTWRQLMQQYVQKSMRTSLFLSSFWKLRGLEFSQVCPYGKSFAFSYNHISINMRKIILDFLKFMAKYHLPVSNLSSYNFPSDLSISCTSQCFFEWICLQPHSSHDSFSTRLWVSWTHSICAYYNYHS